MGAKYGAATSVRSCCVVLGDQDGWGTNRLSKVELILGLGCPKIFHEAEDTLDSLAGISEGVRRNNAIRCCQNGYFKTCVFRPWGESYR